MKNNILKKLLLLIPLVILTVTLFFIDHTVRYVKKTAYDFVYNTNVGSVQRFSKEIDELSSEKYGLSDDDGLFTNMIQVYNKTLGEKEALITFLLDENARIIHSNDSNKAYLAAYLDSLENIYSIEQVASAGRSGEIKLLDKN
ncbi:MAG: hypothetical protein LBU77_05625, partial [Clostridiales bacterium]|nr:hypothetical protein [Clostridiales bacterium]